MKLDKIIIFMLLSAATVVAEAADPLELECLLEPSMVVDLGAPVPGVLSSVLVDRGDTVRKNATVARIDSRAEQAAVELARARADFARRRLDRNEELYRGDLVSIQEKDALTTESLLADLELKERLAEVDMRTVRSPTNGVVVERVRSPGEYVQETEILKLAQINPLNVEVVVPVEYFGQLLVGGMARVQPEAPVSGSYEAKIIVVDRVIDAASSTFGVRLQIPNPKLTIPAGLRCSVRFELAELASP